MIILDTRAEAMDLPVGSAFISDSGRLHQKQFLYEDGGHGVVYYPSPADHDEWELDEIDFPIRLIWVGES